MNDSDKQKKLTPVGAFVLVTLAVFAVAILAAMLASPTSSPPSSRPAEPAPATTPAPAPASAPTWAPVKSWTGNGIKKTESFDVSSREWRVHWETKNEVFAGAGVFQIFVHRASDDALIDLAANRTGIGSDVSYVRAAPGRYYLSINSGNVDWSVRVEDQR